MRKKATNQPVVHEGQVLRAIPTPQLKLATIEDCRREMARVYRDARLGTTDTADASRLVYMLTSIAKMIEVSVLQNPVEPTPLYNSAYMLQYLSAEEMNTLNELLKKCF